MRGKVVKNMLLQKNIFQKITMMFLSHLILKEMAGEHCLQYILLRISMKSVKI